MNTNSRKLRTVLFSALAMIAMAGCASKADKMPDTAAAAPATPDTSATAAASASTAMPATADSSMTAAASGSAMPAATAGSSGAMPATPDTSVPTAPSGGATAATSGSGAMPVTPGSSTTPGTPDSGTMPGAAGDLKLDGAQEVPPVTTTATGSGSITVGTDRMVSGSITTAGIEATAAHIHVGAATANGPVVIPLKKGADNTWTVPPKAKLTAKQYASYKAGNLYVNVHSKENPKGEIRVQLSPK